MERSLNARSLMWSKSGGAKASKLTIIWTYQGADVAERVTFDGAHEGMKGG
jgi:hypothetical protein